MSPSSDRINHCLQRFQAYLETLTWIQIDPRLRAGWSDLIQKTLIEAWQTLERIEAMPPEEQKRWLRRMLLNNLKDQVDRDFAQKCDRLREKSLEDLAQGTSIRLGDWVQAEQSTPSERLIRYEEELRVAEALSQLPANYREAVILKEYHGWKLREIAAHQGTTTSAVAGLHTRGLARLRELLAEQE